MYTSETHAKCMSNDIIARKQNFLAYSYVKSKPSDPNFLPLSILLEKATYNCLWLNTYSYRETVIAII